MFEHCDMVAWRTPISDAELVFGASVLDEEKLAITVKAQRAESIELWYIQFPTTCSYLVFKEGIQTESLEQSRLLDLSGWTLYHTNNETDTGKLFNKFLTKMAAQATHPGNYAMHFQIITDQVTVHVFSDHAPEFRRLGTRSINKLSAAIINIAC